MGEYSASGLSAADVAAMIAAQVPGLIPTQFVGNGAYMTLAQLMATYPPSATYAGLYANVSNLYNGVDMATAGGVQEVVRCRRDVTNGQYNWTAQREGYNSAIAMASGSLTVTPLVTPTTIRLTGTLTANITLALSATNAYVGQKQRIIQNSIFSILTTTITGLIGSNITLLSGVSQDIEYGPSGWFKAS